MSAKKKATPEELEARINALGLDASHAADILRMGTRQHTLRTAVARHDPNVFCRYVLKDEKSGLPIQQAPMHREWHRLMNEHARLVMWSHVEGGKALALDTRIPTPAGFVRMGDLRDGDTVLGGDGAPCRVVTAHAVRHERPCFVVRFDDGSEIVADAEHNWLAFSLDDRSARGSGAPRVVTTIEMKERLKRGRDFMWKVPVAGAAQHEEKALPLPPYVLGAWLGDGASDCSRLTFHEHDAAVWERCRDLVGSCDPVPDVRSASVFTATLGPATHSRSEDGMRARLRELDVLGNKHIPAVYLTASIEQRRELLAGLLDTDGCAVAEQGRGKSRVEFTSKLPALAQGVLQLARSLGFKARMAINASKLYGRHVGVRHRVTFTAVEPVFHLQRKQALLRTGGARPTTRTVVGIDPVLSVPVRCITVDSSDSTFLAGESYTVTHNTTQVAIGRVLFELGLDPSLRVCVVSNTADLAKKMTRLIGQYVEKSVELHAVFPELIPTSDPNLPWKAQALTIARPTASKDPSVQACGVHGNVIGSRIDLLVLDDVLDHENTHTPGPRADVWQWIRSTLFSRLTEHARVWVVGNAWNPEDAMHKMEKEERFVSRRFPVQTETGELTWPERWSPRRIAMARQDLGPMEFARQLLCQARDDASARFKREWVDVAINAGKGLAWCESADDLFDSMEHLTEEQVAEMRTSAESIWRLSGKGAFFTGLDLAISKDESAGLTVLFTIFVDEKRRRRVLNIKSGRWSGPEIIEHVKDIYARFGSIFIIENNAMQQLLIDMLRDDTDIPIVPFTTGRNKAHAEFGVEAVAAELAGGKWLIPNEHVGANGKAQPMHKEVGEWISEMLFYDPKEHTGDRLMASWFAREGARKFVDGVGARSVGVRVV